jgi:hypothetical protein
MNARGCSEVFRCDENQPSSDGIISLFIRLLNPDSFRRSISYARWIEITAQKFYRKSKKPAESWAGCL